jgi:hypothetical protein
MGQISNEHKASMEIAAASGLPELPELPEDLGTKQKAFIIEYIKDFNGAAAAERAGLKFKGNPAQAALNILRRPKVSAYIVAYQREYLKVTHLTKDYVLLKLQEIVDAGLHPKGKRAKQNLAAACRALELIGRHLVMFGDSLPTSKQERVTFNINVGKPEPGGGPTEIDITPVRGHEGTHKAAERTFEGPQVEPAPPAEKTPLPDERAGSSSRTPSPSRTTPPEEVSSTNRLV